MTLRRQILLDMHTTKHTAMRRLMEAILIDIDLDSFRLVYLDQVPYRHKITKLYRHEKVTYQRAAFLGYRFCKGEKPQLWYLLYNPKKSYALSMSRCDRAERLTFKEGKYATIRSIQRS